MTTKIPYNLNYPIWVKLTEAGYEVWKAGKEQYLPKKFHHPVEVYKSVADSDGYVSIQGWEFAQIFGPHIHNTASLFNYQAYVEVEVIESDTDSLQEINSGLPSHEIWLGYYHLGQGYEPPTEPELVATIQAVSFVIACFKYELRLNYESVCKHEKRGRIANYEYGWDYDMSRNSNSWTGAYYPSREAALASFNRTIVKKEV
ncbi:hypothetical protein [Spirosoma sordidisoli]|uniref:Uncharacterized protein n=1 Tax=Spirosoma sordidisoli TaxID=2502893 RepID=A0A4Q2US61_9BACT|nr:hypothetical protein [Spirosoma sordidisoli]RYC70701.1 hypothetical protein EQG79_00685 [Spirosoma sordidisoli]